ncbi:MAG: GNAT family N-acetyltransferase [Ktedonobacteraceae bacterium]
MCFLTGPSVEYKDSYLAAVRELQGEGKRLDDNIRFLSENFAAFVQRSLQQKDRSKLVSGRVPNADFWLIDNGEFVGRLNLRYELDSDLLKFGGHIGYEVRPSRRKQGYGTHMLHLGLELAKAAGIHKVLVTCDENNIGSKKIIEYNGGQFENAVHIDGSAVRKLRYWINV